MRDFHQRGHDNDDLPNRALITATARAWWHGCLAGQ